MLQFLKYHKSYGNYTALQIDNLTINPGIYCIKGVNGSGKSTLLKTLAGILFFQGDILLNEKINVKKQPIIYRNLVNFAEAEPLFPSFLTGKDMLGLFASAKKSSKEQQAYYVESLNMQSYIHHPLATYSSGMIKKLSLALAFLGNPSLILLDEPLITIDTESLRILYSLIAEKHKQQGTNFLLSSHQALEYNALPMAKELVVEQQTLKINK